MSFAVFTSDSPGCHRNVTCPAVNEVSEAENRAQSRKLDTEVQRPRSCLVVAVPEEGCHMTAHQSMLHFIAKRDYNLMRKVNKWSAPKWIRLWAIAATRAGDGWLWYLTGLFVLLFGGDQRLEAVACAGSAALVGIGVFKSLKKFSGRKRPCEIEPHCWATLLPPDQFSFPSGHTITAFSVAVGLGAFYPALMAGLLFCAFSVAISRILLGMHFLSDVVVGAVIGSGLALGSYALFT